MKSILTTILLFVCLSAYTQGPYHLVTDQSFYFSGEQMIVNVMKSNATQAEVITILMCNETRSIIQGNVQMENGMGSIKIQLPDNLSSGVYALQLLNQHGYVGSAPIRINNKDDEDPQKEEVSQPAKVAEYVDVNLSDTLFTAQKASANLILRTGELSTVNVSVTNRKPGMYVLANENASAQVTKEGLSVKGYIRDLEGEALSKHSFMMVVPWANDFFTGQSDEDGYFEIDIDVTLRYFDAVFLSLSPQIHHKIQVELISNDCTTSNQPNAETTSAKRELVNTLINEAFKPLDFAVSNDEEQINYSHFYDRQVRPAEYTSTTMFQVFNDIVPKVHVRKNTFGMYALESTTKLKVPPLIFVNGIPTYDYDYVLNMEVDKVDLIGVIASFRTLRTYFQAGNGGIIEINTVDKDIVPPLTGNIARLRGIDSPVYEEIKINGSEVSFSSLLLYKPGIALKKNAVTQVDFETSLESGTYYFNVSGITNDGEVFHQSSAFVIGQANQ